MFVYIGAITSTYHEPQPPLYLRPEPVPREGNMGEEKRGLSVFDLDMESGALTLVQAVRGLRNPSYVATHPTLPVLYTSERETTRWAPDETMAGNLTTLTIAADGQLTILDRQPSAGGATYVSIHPAGTYVYGAMPGSRSVSVFPVLPDGRLGPATALFQQQGRGVNTITKERPYPHSVRPDITGKRVLSCDMGLDRVTVYDLDETTGQLSPSPYPYAQLSSGAGPRHLWFHPSNRFVYTANETDTTVSGFSYDAESARMRIVATVSTRPEDFAGPTSSAQVVVHPSGRFLYSSVRGANRIAVFSIDQDTGRHRLLGLEPCLGKTPRNFNVDPTGQFLVVANADSNNVVSFWIDQTTGALRPTGHSVDSPIPVCVMFREA